MIIKDYPSLSLYFLGAGVWCAHGNKTRYQTRGHYLSRLAEGVLSLFLLFARPRTVHDERIQPQTGGCFRLSLFQLPLTLNPQTHTQMQAIITKYLPATNFRGSRIKASCERGSITVSYPHELSGEACHVFAVDALIVRFIREDAARYGTKENPWGKPRVVGQIPSGQYVHVFAS